MTLRTSKENLGKNRNFGQKSGLVVSILDSGLEDRGFESHPVLDGNGVKVMQGLITAPKS